MKDNSKKIKYGKYYILVQENQSNRQMIDFELTKDNSQKMYMYSVINGFHSDDELYGFIIRHSIGKYIRAYKDEFEWQTNVSFTKTQIILKQKRR